MTMGRKLSDVISEIEKETGYGSRESDYFDLKEGDNKVRLLSFPEKLVQRWTGSRYEVMIEGDPTEGRTIKWMAWVLDRTDDKVKLATLPHTVVKLIQAFQEDEDYAFDDFPMPYDIKITAKGAGTKEVKYAVIPTPKRTEVDAKALLEGKTDCAEIIKKMKEKRMQGKTADKQWDEMSTQEPVDMDI